jgi:hypothetical protein
MRPSLVYGEDSRSSRLFRLVACLPMLVLPGGGSQGIQPIHIDDLCSATVSAIGNAGFHHTMVPLVGAEPTTLKCYLQSLRRQLGLRPAVSINLPDIVMRLLGRIGDLLPGSLLQSDALTMLNRGSTGDSAVVTALLGQPPQEIGAFIPSHRAAALRMQARLQWLLPLLCIAVALLWLASGVVSLWAYPRESALGLLGQVGIPAASRPAALYAASVMDIALGITCLVRPRSPWTWLVQIAAVLAYTAIITIWLPDFWIHPFGPLTKNIPLLAVLLLLYIRARDKWIT